MDLLEVRKLNELLAQQAIFKVDTSHLATLLVKHFNIEEIDLLAYDMGIDIEEIDGQTKSAKAANLVRYCKRRKLLTQLILNGQELRPTVDWPLPPKE